MNLRIFDSAGDLIRAAARTIQQRVDAGARVIALSGGTTPKPLYEMLGRPPYRDHLAMEAITWVIVDERFVPVDDPQSNAGMIQETLFADGVPPAHRFLRFRTELADAEAVAAAFNEEWKALGIEQLDIALLGMGDDGHTASLFPGTPVLEIDDRISAAVFVPKLDMWRITLTKHVLREAKLRMVLATGEKKRPILDQVREGAELPIALVTRGEIETWWFVDRAAAPET